MSSIITEQTKWELPPAYELNEGSELMESVCKKYCVQDKKGVCTSKLTPKGAQLLSHMRLKNGNDWVCTSFLYSARR